ncbi:MULTISPECIES: anaerobic ribonucleoside-triphosphate reductase [Gemmiger]|nr:MULTISPECIES: anaerobic ribonucleoside-triphosphate reductase [Gemmiger]
MPPQHPFTCSPAILSGKKTNHTCEEEKKMSAMQKQSVVGKDVPFERIRRITGYLVGTMDKWNDAKKAEERDRVKHL